MGEFRFRQFSVRNETSPLKVGTDAVVLGASMTISEDDRLALDIGTGTGVIALLAAQRSPHCRFDAIDIDVGAAAEAAFNFAASPWPDRLQAVCADLRLFTPTSLYDHIFSNPPYFENSLANPDAREASARHTGLLSYRDILSFSALHLTPTGRLSLILPAASEFRIIRTAASFGLYPFRQLRIRTTERKPAKRIVTEFSRARVPQINEENLTLQNGPERTPEYSTLTSAFYL